MYPSFLFDTEYVYLGCWKDEKKNRAIPTLEGKDSRLTGNYKQRANAIELCYEVAKTKWLKIFAIQDNGQCFGGDGGEDYKRYGSSTKCVGGKGGVYANSVYWIIEGIVSIILFNNHNANTHY